MLSGRKAIVCQYYTYKSTVILVNGGIKEIDFMNSSNNATFLVAAPSFHVASI
jgi:hypothetical protein